MLSSTWAMPFNSRYSSISALVVPRRGLIILPLTGGIPQMPFIPLPLARLKRTVSALSSELWAVAMRPQPSFSAVFSRNPYLRFRAASSVPRPFSRAYDATSAPPVSRGIPFSSQKSLTNLASLSDSSPLNPWLKWAANISALYSPLFSKSQFKRLMESAPPETATRTLEPFGIILYRETVSLTFILSVSFIGDKGRILGKPGEIDRAGPAFSVL